MRIRLIDFPRISSFADMAARPAFREIVQIDLDQIPGVHIVADYGGIGEVQCGLRHCRRWHLRGLLVRFPGGEETNVGHVCCAGKFDADWQVQRNMFDALRRVHSDVLTIRDAHDKAEHHRVQAFGLLERERGGRWVSRSLRNFKRVYPKSLWMALVDRARRGESRVMKIARRDETDAFLPEHLKIREEVAGVLAGLDVWKSDPQTILARDVIATLDELARLEVVDASEGDDDEVAALPLLITRLAGRCAQIPKMLELARNRIEAGQAFFTAANFELLPQIVKGTPAERHARFVLWNFGGADGVAMTESQFKRHLSRAS
jgi:hypothetical protein